MKNTHYRICNMASKTETCENEKCILQDLEYGDKPGKRKRKMRNSQDRTWNMARKIENVKNEKHTLQDPEYGKKNDK